MHKREPNPIGSSCSPIPLQFNKKFSKGKFFVFDCQKTLINEQNLLISAEQLIPLLETFDQLGMLWSIIDNTELTHTVTEYIKQNYPLKKDPIYIHYKNTILQDYVEAIDHINKNTHLNDSKEIARLAFANIFNTDFKFGEAYQGITIDENSVWQIKFGQTSIKIQAKEFITRSSKFIDSGFKFFSIFLALDEARLKIKITNSLQAYGIISIETAPGYCEIDLANIVFVGSKEEDCSLLNELGLTTVKASENHLTTIIDEHLSIDQHNAYIQNSQTDASMRPFIEDIKKEIGRICCICDEQPKAEKIAAFNRLIARIYDDKNQYTNPHELLNHWEKDENPIRIDGYSVQDDLRILKENKRPRLGSFLEPLGIQTGSVELFKRYITQEKK